MIIEPSQQHISAISGHKIQERSPTSKIITTITKALYSERIKMFSINVDLSCQLCFIKKLNYNEIKFLFLWKLGFQIFHHLAIDTDEKYWYEGLNLKLKILPIFYPQKVFLE